MFNLRVEDHQWHSLVITHTVLINISQEFIKVLTCYSCSHIILLNMILGCLIVIEMSIHMKRWLLLLLLVINTVVVKLMIWDVAIVYKCIQGVVINMCRCMMRLGNIIVEGSVESVIIHTSSCLYRLIDVVIWQSMSLLLNLFESDKK